MSGAPKAIKLHRKTQCLELQFSKNSYQLSAEFLRVHSPSAEVRGHGPGQETLQLNKQDTKIVSLEAQGNYALKIVFDDGHDSGIYTWSYLHELGINQDSLWTTYQEKVSEHRKQSETSVLTWVAPDTK